MKPTTINLHLLKRDEIEMQKQSTKAHIIKAYHKLFIWNKRNKYGRFVKTEIYFYKMA